MVWKRIAFELISVSSPYYTKNNFHSKANVLANSRKISDVTKKDFFQLIISQSDGQRWSNYCRADFSSVWDPLTSWLS